MSLPDLSLFHLHKVVEDIDLEGEVVPGLRGSFHRREAGARTETVGVYEYGGTEIFMAWGYVGEQHCRYTAYRLPTGDWTPPQQGCPDRARVIDGPAPVQERRGGRTTTRSRSGRER